MRILVLGAGMYVTGRHETGHGVVLSALAQISRTNPVERVLVVARDPANADHVAEAAARINSTLGASLRIDYQTIPGIDLALEMAALCSRERFDCAIVSTPDHLHEAPLRGLMGGGVPTLVVKPLAPTLAEGRALLALQRETGVYCAVEFHKRFDEGNLYAKRVITEGALGRLLYMSVDYSQRIQIPRQVFRNWTARSNIFQYLGVHYVDLIHFLTGFHPRRVTAYGTRGILEREGIDAFDSIHVMIEWDGPLGRNEPFLSHHNSNWIDPDTNSAMSDQRFKIVGTKGRIECDQRNRGIELVREGTGVALINPYYAEFLPDVDGNLEFQGYSLKSIARFIADVVLLKRGETSLSHLDKTRPSLRQALVSTAVIDAVNRALCAGPAWREIDGFS